MVKQADPQVPVLGQPDIPGDQAEARGLIWADPEAEAAAGAPETAQRIPVDWVEDAVRGALAQYQDDIVDAAVEELRRKLAEEDGDDVQKTGN